MALIVDIRIWIILLAAGFLDCDWFQGRVRFVACDLPAVGVTNFCSFCLVTWLGSLGLVLLWQKGKILVWDWFRNSEKGHTREDFVDLVEGLTSRFGLWGFQLVSLNILSRVDVLKGVNGEVCILQRGVSLVDETVVSRGSVRTNWFLTLQRLNTWCHLQLI